MTEAAADLMSKFDPLIAERQKLLDSGVTDPFAIVMEQVKSPTEAVIKGKDTILLGTYNYMGMTFDPDVIQAGKDALDQFGSGTNGSRMLNGTFRDRMEVEQALRDFYGDDKLLWASDYPHPDSVWPNSRKTIDEFTKGADPEFVRKITWDNAAKLYGIARPAGADAIAAE